MLKVRREFTLKNQGYMDLALVGIDQGGSFHVAGKNSADTLEKADSQEIVWFVTFDRKGEITAETSRLKREMEELAGGEPLFAVSGWRTIQERLGVFPAVGEMYYEAEPLDLDYFPKKDTSYHARGPFDPDLPSRGEMIWDDLKPGNTWALLRQLFNYVSRSGSLSFLREPQYRWGGFVKMAFFYLNPEDFYRYPLRYLIDPRRLLDEGGRAFRDVPAAKELLSSLAPLLPEERQETLELLNHAARLEEEEMDRRYQDAIEGPEDDHLGGTEEDEIGHDDPPEDTYSEVLGLASQQAISGIWIDARSALVLRRCVYLLRYQDGERATDDLRFLDLVTPQDDGRFEVIHFTVKDFDWLRSADALIVAGDNLFARKEYLNEFYDVELIEFELIPSSTKL